MKLSIFPAMEAPASNIVGIEYDERIGWRILASPLRSGMAMRSLEVMLIDLYGNATSTWPDFSDFIFVGCTHCQINSRVVVCDVK